MIPTKIKNLFFIYATKPVQVTTYKLWLLWAKFCWE